MRDALKLMRIPFSIFLMPVFWLALINLDAIPILKALLIFIIVHLLVYPASNGYNSYFDKDEGSIGGLKHPPKVNRHLFPIVLCFDFFAVVLSLFLSWQFSILILIYILVSKAYSYDKIRLKKYPIISTAVVILFQGFFMYLTIQFGLKASLGSILLGHNLLLAVSSSLFLLGSYPLTQVYQHEEDSKRGDKTLSILLGIKGTFLFSSFAFLFGTLCLSITLIQLNRLNDAFLFLALGAPILLYFSVWFFQVSRNSTAANYEHTMRMNKISSISLSIAFFLMIVL